MINTSIITDFIKRNPKKSIAAGVMIGLYGAKQLADLLFGASRDIFTIVNERKKKGMLGEQINLLNQINKNTSSQNTPNINRGQKLIKPNLY